MIYNNILDLIGKTPLLRLNKLTQDLDAEILVKLEYFNPGGSIKDRVGLNMIEDAEIGVAMSNATSKIKEVAKYITKSNNESGVAYAIKKWAIK